MSFWASAIVAANSAVIAPTQAIVVGTQSYDAAMHRVDARQQEHATCHHRGRVDQRRHRASDPPWRRAATMYSGSCALLPAAPISSSNAIAEAVDAASCTGLGALVEHGVRQRSDRRERQEHRQHDAPVADAVGDEGLLAGGRRRLAGVPESDQQVRTRADPLPAEERDQQVLAEHEQRHREDEQVQVQEELGELRVAVHVADGEHVDPARR